MKAETCPHCQEKKLKTATVKDLANSVKHLNQCIQTSPKGK